MALLDVSEVITDPLFTSPVRLVGMVQTYDENGNPVWQESSSAEIMAVVTADMKTLERLRRTFRAAGMTR